MPEINGDWFRAKLTEHNRSQRALARHLNLDPSAITLMLRGERRMQMKEAQDIAAFLGEPLVDVLRAAGLPLKQGVVEAVATPAPDRNEAVRHMLDKAIAVLRG